MYCSEYARGSQRCSQLNSFTINTHIISWHTHTHTLTTAQTLWEGTPSHVWSWHICFLGLWQRREDKSRRNKTQDGERRRECVCDKLTPKWSQNTNPSFWFYYLIPLPLILFCISVFFSLWFPCSWSPPSLFPSYHSTSTAVMGAKDILSKAYPE